MNFTTELEKEDFIKNYRILNNLPNEEKIKFLDLVVIRIKGNLRYVDNFEYFRDEVVNMMMFLIRFYKKKLITRGCKKIDVFSFKEKINIFSENNYYSIQVDHWDSKKIMKEVENLIEENEKKEEIKRAIKILKDYDNIDFPMEILQNYKDVRF